MVDRYVNQILKGGEVVVILYYKEIMNYYLI